MLFIEPSESLFVATVRATFDDVRRHGFDVVAPMVYGCTYTNATRAVTVSYDRRQRCVRTVLQRRLVIGEQPAPPDVNLVTELTPSEQPIDRQLSNVLDAHLAAICAQI